nr:NADPH-dependent F420 reductase [Nocardioides panaciterrulae]
MAGRSVDPEPTRRVLGGSGRRGPSRGREAVRDRRRNDRTGAAVLPSMTTIGLIGSGHIGSTVARLAVNAGHDVVLSNSRGPETLADLVDELGEHARAATAAEAAEAGEIVVVTIPLKNYRQVPVEPLRGKVVIDTNNYYPQRDGHIAELDEESTTTAEMLQAHLPDSHVVKAFNNIYFGHLLELARPADSPERSVLAIAGDDDDAKQTVTGFLDSIGYDAYDVGPLAEGWRYQRDTAAYATLYDGGDGSTWPPTQPRQVTADFLQEKLAEAKRYRDM